MMRDNIIEKLEGPSSWIKSYVIERKQIRKLWICLGLVWFLCLMAYQPL